MQENLIPDEASLERDKQRLESEARAIIHDVNQLFTIPSERKTRWIWELFQNANDVAGKDGIHIHIRLSDKSLNFRHNGKPFSTRNLLAILYKTSTKSLDNDDGTTGKYGSGFVTTHILNKRLTISGVHENQAGKRRFKLEIDRSAALLQEKESLTAMQKSLEMSYKAISDIAKIEPEEITDHWNEFSFDLKPDSYVHSVNGLHELKQNLAFTLLINTDIKRVTIESPGLNETFEAKDDGTSIEGTRFISLNSDTGLLYYKSGNLTFGIPAIAHKEAAYKLLPIENQAILFKEFPLIGTEKFNLPVFIQHTDFHPTELRDGIRTNIASEGEPDPVAEKNRLSLVEFQKAYVSFMEALMKAKVPGAYLFAKSGLPEHVDVMSNRKWFTDTIQTPIRDSILKKDIVSVCKGPNKPIAGAKFISRDVRIDYEAFYDLASRLLPDQIPDKESVWHWEEIILQESDRWPEGIMFQVEDMIRLVPETLNLSEESSFEWLKDLYSFLEKNSIVHLAEKHPIYPNEENVFCFGEKVFLHPLIDEEFKVVSKGLGRVLEYEFLSQNVGTLLNIKEFDLNGFFSNLNKVISELNTESASPVQMSSIFQICTLFRSDRAVRREEWLKILKDLLPENVGEKKLIKVNYENFSKSAELWSVKYLCQLIEKAQTPTLFCQTYFQGHNESCFDWLNRFIAFVFDLPEEGGAGVLKRSIIPMQADEFKPYVDSVFSEENSKYFNDSIKDIYKTHTRFGDPRLFLIDNRIQNKYIRKKEVNILTLEIDNIFNDEKIETKVAKGGSLNEMFMQLNNWYEEWPVTIASGMLPTFSNKRNLFYVLALGEGFSKSIIEIQKSGKSIEDINELAKISLTPEEMRLFDSAAATLGVSKLLDKASEMIAAKLQIERWKTIGKAAELAFKEALSQTNPVFQILNPDIGRDFLLVLNGIDYSVEIKSVDPSKGNVNMSITQGQCAVNEKSKYALCVLSRPDDETRVVDKDYFIETSRFVPTIGEQIGNSIELWKSGLQSLDTKSDVKVSLDEKTESIYVGRAIWKEGISFERFILLLKTHFTG